MAPREIARPWRPTSIKHGSWMRRAATGRISRCSAGDSSGVIGAKPAVLEGRAQCAALDGPV